MTEEIVFKGGPLNLQGRVERNPVGMEYWLPMRSSARTDDELGRHYVVYRRLYPDSPTFLYDREEPWTCPAAKAWMESR